jgi:hypothetical protein
MQALLTLTIALSLATAVLAEEVLYDNGPVSGPQTFRSNHHEFTIYDEFEIATSAVVTRVEWFQLENESDELRSNGLDTSCGIPADGTRLATVTAVAQRTLAPSSVPGAENEGPATVSGLNVPLGPGIYWLGIHNDWALGGGASAVGHNDTGFIPTRIKGRAQGETFNCVNRPGFPGDRFV